MKLGIFSDVHANLEGMRAVLAAYKHYPIDTFYCLGDVVGYGANPNECADIVKKIAAVTVVGNHDAAVAGRMDYSFYYDAARDALTLHRQMITDDNALWLKGLPYKHDLDEFDIQLCHGSPYRTEDFEYIFAPEHVYPCFDMWDELKTLTLIGHTHLCKVFALKDGIVKEIEETKFTLEPGWKYIASVGSVGQPRDYDNRAALTVYDTETKTFEFLRVPYDIESAAEKIFASKLDDSFGHRLFLGL